MTAIIAESAVLTGMPAVTALQRKKSCSAARMAMSWDFGHLCSREGKIHGLMMTGWLTSSDPSNRDIRTVRSRYPLGRNQKKAIRDLKMPEQAAIYSVMRRPVRNIIVIFIRRV